MSNNSNKKTFSEEEKNAYKAKMREIREQSFAVLFEMTFSDDSYEDILDAAVESRMIEAEKYMTDILRYYSENKDKVDETIKANLRGWTMARLSRTTLSILRMAISEMKCTSTKESIVINEAIEIAKKYASPKEASFVNGVLGSVVKNETAE